MLNWIKQIGKGGLGVVHLYQDSSGVFYAVKMMHDGWDERSYKRFEEEMRLIGQLRHPNIVRLIQGNLDLKNPYYIMPYFEKGTLKDRIDKLRNSRKRMHPSRVIEIVCSIAAALDHAHRLGVYHRDLKPANILFDDREPIVADWGIGRYVHQQSQHLAHTVHIGTQVYCAPEQWFYGQCDARSDIYSLGVMLRELLTGARNGKISEDYLSAVVRKMTAQSPKDRFQSMEGVIAALENYQYKVPQDTGLDLGELIEGLAKVAFVGVGIWAGIRLLGLK